MLKCDKGIYDAFQKVATHNTWESKRAKHEMIENDDGSFTRIVKEQGTYFDFVDGYSQCKDDDDGNDNDNDNDSNDVKTINGSRLLFTLYNDEGANSVHRAHFLSELLKLIPSTVTRFNKRLSHITGDSSSPSDHPLTLHFTDSTTSTADLIIGTDGIKSTIRAHLLSSSSSPSSSYAATYTNKYAYRGLIPMSIATDHLGATLTQNATMHLGPSSHLLTFPIQSGTHLNLVAFHTPSPAEPWPSTTNLTLPTTLTAALTDFRHFQSKTVQTLLSLLPPTLDRWAIFEMAENPAPTYNNPQVAISGDAAHATSPHHGSGAGFAIEDSAVLAELISYLHNAYSYPSSDNNQNQKVMSKKKKPKVPFNKAIEIALSSYTKTRLPRTQWLVDSSRRTGDLFEWRADGVGADIEKIRQELEERHRVIWDGDIEAYCDEAVGRVRAVVEGLADDEEREKEAEEQES